MVLVAEVSGSNYWRDPFNSVFDPKQLTEFTVMDVEPIIGKKNFPGQGQISSKVINSLTLVYILFVYYILNIFRLIS